MLGHVRKLQLRRTLHRDMINPVLDLTHATIGSKLGADTGKDDLAHRIRQDGWPAKASPKQLVGADPKARA